MRDLRADRERTGDDRVVDPERVAVGVDELQQRVLDHHRQSERDQQRGQDAAIERGLDHGPLQHVAQHRHQRHHDHEGPQHRDVGDRDDADRDVAADDRQVAVRQVDHLHDPEHQREPAGEQRVQAADQDPLDDVVDPDHYGLLAAPRRPAPVRQAEVGDLHLFRGDVRRLAFQRGPPLEQALQVRGHPQRLAHVLLHQQHGQPGGQDLRQHAVDPLHDHRREAQGQLVEQQHPRVGHQRPADGHRLLLTAGKLLGALGPPVLHPGEQLVDPLDRPRSLPRVGRADLQVLLDRERSEQPPALRHHDDPADGPAFGPDPGHVLAVVPDRALGGLVQAGDRAQQRRLARPVGADDRVHLAREHPQRDVVQGPQLPMVHGQVADLQYRALYFRPRSPPGRSSRRRLPSSLVPRSSVQASPRAFGSLGSGSLT